jgi:hypothetical protein
MCDMCVCVQPGALFVIASLLAQGDIQLTYDKIETGEFDIPDFVSEDAQHLIRLVRSI